MFGVNKRMGLKRYSAVKLFLKYYNLFDHRT